MPASAGLRTELVAPGLPGLLWERFGLGRTLRRGDLLFAPTNLIPSNWRGPTVLVMFDALQERRPDEFSRLVRLRFGRRYRNAVARADRVIVPSEATAADLSRVYGLSRDRMTVIHPAPEPAFRPLAADAMEVRQARETLKLGGAPFFLFVGKQSRRRNIPAILDAFRRHRIGFPSHRLVFVGEVADRGLPNRCEGDGVLNAGHVSEPILRGLMATARAVLYPSEHEGFGLPVVEAMASGCPVITLRRDALIEAGGDGPVYLDEATAESLAAAMSSLATESSFRAERVAIGLEHASRFRMEAFAAAVTRELQRVWDESGLGESGRRR
ncbi:MAG: glycosyltransferase [Planctomycetota bacterium]|nr:glycosyltransferase [Planctomycetota bacterium]